MGYEIRTLTHGHACDLTAFTCAGYREPASVIVEEMVQEHLAEAIATGLVHGIGLWEGNDLCGVVAWTVDADACVFQSCVLAVRVTRQNRGVGRLLKEHLLRTARDAGARAVVSEVHEDNVAMLRLNRRFGATVERHPRYVDYFVCAIPVTRDPQ